MDARTGGGVEALAPEDVPVAPLPSGLPGWFREHRIVSYLMRRLALYLVTLWGSFTVTFFFFRLIPGNPIRGYVQAMQTYAPGLRGGRAFLDYYDRVFDLNGSLLQQYLAYLYQLVVRHNMGPSLIAYPTPALALVGQAVPWTLGLLGTSAVIAWLLGVLLGGLAGWARDTRLSKVLTYAALATSNLPFFFVAILLILVFAFDLDLLPYSYPYGAGLQVGLSLPFILSLLNHALIPAFSLVLVSMFTTFLTMRQQMITVLGEDYVTFATAKGLRPWRLLRRYGMPNCYLPQITGAVINLGFIFSGNLILENFFIYPGVGHLLGLALHQLDFDTLMAITDVTTFMVLSAVFLIDMVLPLLDPRIRTG